MAAGRLNWPPLCQAASERFKKSRRPGGGTGTTSWAIYSTYAGPTVRAWPGGQAGRLVCQVSARHQRTTRWRARMAGWNGLHRHLPDCLPHDGDRRLSPRLFQQIPPRASCQAVPLRRGIQHAIWPQPRTLGTATNGHPSVPERPGPRSPMTFSCDPFSGSARIWTGTQTSRL
jgi:hypothetical protein